MHLFLLEVLSVFIFIEIIMKKTSFAFVEDKLRQKWEDDDTFNLSVLKRNNDKEYVFFDGPPFANGLPHYGHLLTGFIKDIYARYHTMKGEKVERRFGWDCHGLPAEMGVEKMLTAEETKITNEIGEEKVFSGGKQDVKHLKPNSKRSEIEGFDGIEEFNRLCRADVQKYTREWKEYVTKQGRWVDFDGGYRTMETPYMESVIWAFNELYKKGLIYEDYRVMPYSWKCQTPVSNFETKMDNAYRQHESKSVYLKFKLKKIPEFVKKTFPECKNCYMLAWTTTPWTLPSNLALAVNSEIDYCAFEKSGDIYICANNLKDKVRKNLT
jgi:isoleucyl-tRNA synthetase